MCATSPLLFSANIPLPDPAGLLSVTIPLLWFTLLDLPGGHSGPATYSLAQLSTHPATARTCSQPCVLPSDLIAAALLSCHRLFPTLCCLLPTLLQLIEDTAELGEGLLEALTEGGDDGHDDNDGASSHLAGTASAPISSGARAPTGSTKKLAPSTSAPVGSTAPLRNLDALKRVWAGLREKQEQVAASLSTSYSVQVRGGGRLKEGFRSSLDGGALVVPPHCHSLHLLLLAVPGHAGADAHGCVREEAGRGDLREGAGRCEGLLVWVFGGRRKSLVGRWKGVCVGGWVFVGGLCVGG